MKPIVDELQTIHGDILHYASAACGCDNNITKMPLFILLLGQNRRCNSNLLPSTLCF